MIHAQNAVLRVKRIRQSRNGAFCIADLTTDFGEFKVKESLLDQFDEGTYEATVWIDEIYMGQYVAYGKAVTEIRARLRDVQVLTEDQRPVTEEIVEPDPLEEQPQPAPVIQKPPVQEEPRDKRWDKFKKSKEEAAPVQDAEESETANNLFDEETWSAMERAMPVKLDASVDRALLRQQAGMLRQRGYRFDAKQQIWLFTS